MRVIRVLTIGNSFSNNALTYLERIAGGTDAVRFDVGRASLGGCSLERHWNLAAYTEKHPDYKTYDLCKGEDGAPVRVNLQDALVAKPWDYVTLQQVSRKSWRMDSFEPFLDRLHGLVSGLAPRAKVMLHQTWAYRSDTPYYAEHVMTQKLMHQRIRETYLHYAGKYGCGILPSGDAIAGVRQTLGQQFTWPDPNYDYQKSEAPALPNEEHSLAVGRFWRIRETEDGIPRLHLDANHLNERGCYLCSAVWFEVLAGLPVSQSAFEPDDIEPEDARFLRGMAHATVANS